MNVSRSAGTEETPKKPMDHISEKGYVSDFGHGLHRCKRRDENLQCQGRSGRLTVKVENQRAWDFKKIKPNSEVVRQARTDGRPVHCASRPLPSQTHGTCETPQGIQGERRVSGRQRQGRQLIESRNHGIGIISTASGRSKIFGFMSRLLGMAG